MMICLGLNIPTIFAESHVNKNGEASFKDSDAQQTMTLTNDYADRPQLEKLKHSAEKNNITLQEALDIYIEEMVSQGLGGDYEGNVENNKNLEDLPSLPPEITIDGLTLDELEDLKLIAENEGISFAEAIDRFGWQNEFAQFADKMEEAYPNSFAGAGLYSDGKGAWIAFKDNIPSVAKKVAATLPATMELIGGKGFSELELKSEMEGIHDQIYQRKDIENVYSYYDIESGVITVEALPIKSSLSLSESKKLMQELQPEQISNSNITININVVKQLDGGNESKYIRSGGYLGTCTAGFTVRNNGSGRGISTAHHCGGKERTYRNHSGDGGSTTVTRKSSHKGKYGDLARYSVGNKTATRTFYYANNKKRYATAVSSPRVGMAVCNFGKTTGHKCDTVYKLNTARDGYKGMTAVSRHITDKGDSGGPWFYGATAYGIHSGYQTISKIRRSQFSPAVNMQNAVGMRVNIKE